MKAQVEGKSTFFAKKAKEKKVQGKQFTPVLEEGQVVGSSLVKGLLSAQLDSAGKQDVPSPSGQNGVSSV